MNRSELDYAETARLALDGHPVSTLVVRTSGHVIYWNAAGREGFENHNRCDADIATIEDWQPPRRPLREVLHEISLSSNWTPLRLIRENQAQNLRARGLASGTNGRTVLVTGAPDVSAAFISHTMQIERLHAELARRQKVEEKLRAAVETSNMLKRELVHRVKNNLAVISALIRSEARSLDQSTTSSVLTETASRIMSISVAHELLDASGEVDSVDVGDLIRELAKRMTTSILPPEVTLSVSAESALASSNSAAPIALIVNELVTNAVKHAFVGREEGSIAITFTRRPGGYELIVSDDGIGMPLSASGDIKTPRIVAALATQLEAELFCESKQGSAWRVSIPSLGIVQG